MKKIFAFIIALVLSFSLTSCSSQKNQDFIVIFLPDGQTIEGIGRITVSGYASVWVEIDGIKYKTGVDNVLVIRTP